MAYCINLGQWNSIFAVPSAVADRHLKLASEAQLKVLLYLLRHAGEDCPDDEVARAVGISADEVKNAADFWTERGLLTKHDGALAPPEQNPAAVASTPVTAAETPAETKKSTRISRAVRPDSYYVSKRLTEDSNLAGLRDEVESITGNGLASGDIAMLVMLNDSFGLPCEVIAMLIHSLADTGRLNMRAVERIGIEWSDKGVYTAEAAEQEIERMAASREAWGRVSSLIGLRNAGHPTTAQLTNAARWLIDWGFNDEMINEAYERCVNTKGEYNMSYINAILKKWYEKKIFSLDALKEAEQRPAHTPKKPNRKGSVFSADGASFDMNEYESKSLFDD